MNAIDYGHPLEFGYFLTPDAGDPLGVLETARLLDGLGYDLIGVQDHPYHEKSHVVAAGGDPRADDGSARLRRRRQPAALPAAVLAKASATLDLLSGGRFELGVGTGGFLDAAHAMGAQALTPGESLAALEEGIAVIRAMWNGERRGIRFDGRYYQLAGVRPDPPRHPIQVWIGANKPRALAVTGRVADGWVSPLMSYKPPREAAQANLAIDRAAREAGRDPREIRRIYNVQGAFAPTADGPAATPTRHRRPARHWVDVLTHLRSTSASARLCSPPRPTHTARHLRRGVAPLVRERVAEGRGMTMSEFEDRPETARGRWLYQSLLAVHALIRRDLATVEQLAADVLDGLPANDVHEELEALKSNGLLWQFQVSCLRYCGFVHMHHHAEDMPFFDELEETNRAIRPVVERLRADHRAVSDSLDAVEAATRALSEDDGHRRSPCRRRRPRGAQWPPARPPRVRGAERRLRNGFASPRL